MLALTEGNHSLLPSIIMSYTLDGPAATNGAIPAFDRQIEVEFPISGPTGYLSEYLVCSRLFEDIILNQDYILVWRGCWVVGQWTIPLHFEWGVGLWRAFSVKGLHYDKVLPVLFPLESLGDEQHIFQLHYKILAAARPALANHIGDYSWQFGEFFRGNYRTHCREVFIICRLIHHASPNLCICPPPLEQARC